MKLCTYIGDMVRLFIIPALIIVGSLLYTSSLASAQVGGLDTGGNFRVSPTYPQPNSELTISLEIYSLSLDGASIRWSVDGVALSDSDNARTMTLTTGPFGTSQSVRATITPQNGGTVIVQETIAPSQIDMIVEADTRVPSFYKGRALPASDEPVSITAIPHIPGYINTSGLMYKWTLGSTVLFGGPVRGKTTASFTMPKRQSTLFLEITNANGTVLGGEAISLKPATPELYFYEHNPLRGITERALSDTLTLVDTETTVRAEPYFVAQNIFDVGPIAGWTIDGQNANYGEDVRTLTLRSEGGSGEARVGFSLTHPQLYLQSVQRNFLIHFE